MALPAAVGSFEAADAAETAWFLALSDRFKSFTFVLHISLSGLNKIGDQVISSF